MKLKIVRKAIEDEPEDGLVPHNLLLYSGLDKDDCEKIYKACISETKRSILARIEEYRKNPPIK